MPPSPPPLLWQVSQQPLHPTAQMASKWTRASKRWEGSLLATSQSLPRLILKNSKQYRVLNNKEKWIISRAALAQECSKEPYFPKTSTGEVLWSEELGRAAYYPSTAYETCSARQQILKVLRPKKKICFPHLSKAFPNLSEPQNCFSTCVGGHSLKTFLETLQWRTEEAEREASGSHFWIQ